MRESALPFVSSASALDGRGFRVLYGVSTTTANGVLTTFAFSDLIDVLVVAYIGGVAQLPADCTVVNGSVVFAPALSPITDPVTALYYKA